jgi:hypothetical protein
MMGYLSMPAGTIGPWNRTEIPLVSGCDSKAAFTAARGRSGAAFLFNPRCAAWATLRARVGFCFDTDLHPIEPLFFDSCRACSPAWRAAFVDPIALRRDYLRYITQFDE